MGTESKVTPLLPQIDSPADLRQLKVEQLPQVCSEIRDFLIQSLSKNAGHFASGMGAVELTVALHYVFNTPYDRIVWDVGHQAYGHKILTGRREAFSGNRKMGGLSGFPNPKESEYDTFSAGHASNSISAALGMAIASKLNNDSPRRNIVAVIGDASISGGLAFEGLNNAANTPNNLLIILNDNDMSIDRNVGSLNSHLAHLTTSKAYNNARYKAYKTLKKLHLVSDKSRGPIMRFNNSLKALLSREQNIFEGLNIRYFGPFDGHDVEKIVRVLNDIKDLEGPRILHLRTVKGKGYAPAEENPSIWHAPGKFNPATGECDAAKVPGENDPLKFQEVFGLSLRELMEKNPKIVAVTAAMPSGTSVSIPQKEFPDRVFDVGISEGHAVTFAGGMAKDGLHPFVAIYSSFLQRGYDNIINDVALQKLPVTFCIDRAGLVGEDGPTHHGALDMAYLRAVPALTVAAASDADTLMRLMLTGAGLNGPMAIRYPRGKSDACVSDISLEGRSALPVGKGRTIYEGRSTAVLTIGTVLADARKAVEQARADGKEPGLYDMLFIKPLDTELLDKIFDRYERIITVEDGTIKGGFGSAVAEYMLQRKGKKNPSISMLGIPDKFVTQGTPAQLKELVKIDSPAIYKAITEG